MKTAATKRCYERSEFKKQATFDCPDGPLHEVKPHHDRPKAGGQPARRVRIFADANERAKTVYNARILRGIQVQRSGDFVITSPEASQLLGAEALAAFTKLLDEAADNSRPVMPVEGGVWDSHVQ